MSFQDDDARQLFAKIRRTARWWSKRLGHHEIISPEHIFLTLCPNYTDFSLDQLTTIAKRKMPPWGDMVVISPGGLVPSARAVLDCAYELAANDGRSVTRDDVWLALRETDPERFANNMALIETTDWD